MPRPFQKLRGCLILLWFGPELTVEGTYNDQYESVVIIPTSYHLRVIYKVNVSFLSFARTDHFALAPWRSFKYLTDGLVIHELLGVAPGYIDPFEKSRGFEFRRVGFARVFINMLEFLRLMNPQL